MFPTTLETIAYLFVFGSTIGAVSVLLFGVAVRRRSINIAPRCTARPTDTIHSFGPFTEENKCQNRGNPFTGWVLWTLKLSYGTMLKGIPGTGTRAKGLKGKMLDVNLDGIILLRFHVLCSKVAMLTTLLALGVVLPLNLTAGYFSQPVDGIFTDTDPTNDNQMTNYARTTLANIPASVSHHTASTSGSYEEIPVLFRPFFTYEWGGSSSNRLYGIVLCAWIIYYYTCSLLKKEWKEALALRRVYYLENDMWARRKRELEATIYAPSDEDESDGSINEEEDYEGDSSADVADVETSKFESLRRKREKRHNAWVKKQKRKHDLRKRSPWIPPPEQRETVPNIELYSVLVGGLPCLPSEVLLSKQGEAAGFNQSHSAIDWQLELVSSFFNHCVPTQPGFSSSVVAVTILPDAPSLARAWRRWYAAAAALRRLRFIRTLISEIRHYNIELSDSSDEDDGANKEASELPLSNHGYVEAPHVFDSSAVSPTIPSGMTPIVSTFFQTQPNSFNPLNNQGHAASHPPLQSTGNVVSPSVTPALSTSVARPQKLTAVDRNLTSYTEQWWKNNQTTALGQQFMHTFTQQNANQEHPLAPSSKGFVVQNNSGQQLAVTSTTVRNNSELQSNANPTWTCFNHSAPDPNELHLDAEDVLHDADDDDNYFDPAEQAQFALSYYRNVFGADDNFDVEAQFFQALQFGPEQSSVYSRELAQSAANCCPYGCGESRLRRCGIDELLDLERETVIKVHNANIALQCAQARAAISVLASRGGGGGKRKKKNTQESFIHDSDNKAHCSASEAGEPGITPNRNKSKSSSKRTTPTLSPRFRNRKGSPSPVPKNLQIEWELLVKENARKEILSNNSNHTPVQPNSYTLTMENTNGSSLPPPPPLSRKIKLNGGGLVKASSVRFSQQASIGTDEAPMGRHVGLAKAASARYLTQQQLDTEGFVIDHESNLHPTSSRRDDSSVGKTEENSKAIPIRYPSNQIDVDIKGYKPLSQIKEVDHNDNKELGAASDFNNAAATEPSNQPIHKTRERGLTADSISNRERCLTSESALSSVSFNQPMNNNWRHQSRWTGLSLTSEGMIAARRAPTPTNHASSSCMNSHGDTNISFITGTALSPSTGLLHRCIEDFDPYAVMKHKKSDGDVLLGNRTRMCSWDDSNVDESKRSNLNRRKLTRHQSPSTMNDLIGLDQWAKVEQICNSHNGGGSTSDDAVAPSTAETTPKTFDNGVWDPYTVVESTKDSIRTLPRRLWDSIASFARKKSDKISDRRQSNSTYAVVTFTNRQAALAARHLVADGRGANRWIAVETLPVPPLSDSASCDIITCRGCCRPLSLSVSSHEKMIRKYLAIFTLVMINIFYCFPMTAAASLVTPQLFYGVPYFEELAKSNPLFKNLAGAVQASLFSLFFALCPLIFRAIANAGSNATSVATAEKAAINYFWWFMVVTAFSGTSFMMMGKTYFMKGELETNVTQVLLQIAATIPTTVSATWINWIILHSTFILPNQYLLQFNSFVFQFLGWNCCARAVKGGGPGGNIPYRLYVDSCVVLMCTIALSPASPIVAPCAALYFLIMFPLLRRNFIFVYRPKFDGGGHRWTFLFQACITSMLVGQILLSLMMGLKKAIGPALMAAVPIPLTLVFRSACIKRFYRAYKDAGLLQTSLLDQWDTSCDSSSHPSMEKREEFRRFLVDAHKAAYIPVCIAGDATSSLTVEPAIVVPLESDDVIGSARSQDKCGSSDSNFPHVFQATSI